MPLKERSWQEDCNRKGSAFTHDDGILNFRICCRASSIFEGERRMTESLNTLTPGENEIAILVDATEITRV